MPDRIQSEADDPELFDHPRSPLFVIFAVEWISKERDNKEMAHHGSG